MRGETPYRSINPPEGFPTEKTRVFDLGGSTVETEQNQVKDILKKRITEAKGEEDIKRIEELKDFFENYNTDLGKPPERKIGNA